MYIPHLELDCGIVTWQMRAVKADIADKLIAPASAALGANDRAALDRLGAAVHDLRHVDL